MRDYCVQSDVSTPYLLLFSIDGTMKHETIFSNGKIDKVNLIKFVKNVKKYPGITDEDAAKLAATRLLDSTHRGAMWYRIGAVRIFTGGKQINPVLEEHLKQVLYKHCSLLVK